MREKDLLRIQCQFMCETLWYGFVWLPVRMTRSSFLTWLPATEGWILKCREASWLLGSNQMSQNFQKHNHPDILLTVSDYGVFWGQKVKMFLPGWVSSPIWTFQSYISFTEGKKTLSQAISENVCIVGLAEYDWRRYPGSQIVIVCKMNLVSMRLSQMKDNVTQFNPKVE